MVLLFYTISNPGWDLIYSQEWFDISNPYYTSYSLFTSGEDISEIKLLHNWEIIRHSWLLKRCPKPLILWAFGSLWLTAVKSISILFANFRKYFTPDLYNLRKHLFLHFQKMQHPKPGLIIWKQNSKRLLHNIIKWSVRLGVRTPGFHPGNRGSIPLRTTKKLLHTSVQELFLFSATHPFSTMSYL